MRRHTDSEYEAELTQLRENLIAMGEAVGAMIDEGLQALRARESDRAARVIEADHHVNKLEVETDELCLRVLALRQPVATDLRAVTIALKLVTDLERVGDLAVNIAERAIELNEEPAVALPEPLVQMADMSRVMLTDVLQAFVSGDVDLAQQVIDRDRTVDALYAQAFRELLTLLTGEPTNVRGATRLLSVSKYLERIGDHATNCAELVIFMVKGKDVRHLGQREEAERLPHGVLFICAQNSARSQMAEGFARRLLPAGVRVWSAGTQPAAQVHPDAVAVMREVGIDISGQQPKPLSDVPLGDVDVVVTVCAEEVCVSLPRLMRRLTWAVRDPAASGKEGIEAFRRARDEIRQRLAEITSEVNPV